MTPAKYEGRSQEEVLLLMRGAIDTAMKQPSEANINAAIKLATQYPRALSSAKLRLNLGQQRWAWLNERGIYPVYAGVTDPEFKT